MLLQTSSKRPFNIRIDTPKLELTEGQRRRVAATSRIRIQGLAKKMERENQGSYLLQALRNTLRIRSKKKDRFSLISKEGEVKTFSEMEFETDKDKDEEDINIEKERLLYKGVGIGGEKVQKSSISESKGSNLTSTLSNRDTMAGGSLYHRRLLVHGLDQFCQPGGYHCPNLYREFFGYCSH